MNVAQLEPEERIAACMEAIKTALAMFGCEFAADDEEIIGGHIYLQCAEANDPNASIEVH